MYASEIRVGGEATSTLHALLSEARRSLVDNPNSAERCLARAVQMLRGDTRAISLTPSGGLAPWQMLRLQRLVETRLGERLTTAEMASAVQLSPSHLTRAFSRSFGASPHAYVMQARVDRAKALMSIGDEPLSAIALACGFSDQAHFCRLFRRSEGEAPAAWRRLRAVPAEVMR